MLRRIFLPAAQKSAIRPLPCSSSSAKRPACCGCSVVNALPTPPQRYHLFAGIVLPATLLYQNAIFPFPYYRSKVRFAPANFFACGPKIRHPPAPLLLLFRKKARLLRLLGCKRPPNASAALPPFCGYRSSSNSFISKRHFPIPILPQQSPLCSGEFFCLRPKNLPSARSLAPPLPQKGGSGYHEIHHVVRTWYCSHRRFLFLKSQLLLSPPWATTRGVLFLL